MTNATCATCNTEFVLNMNQCYMLGKNHEHKLYCNKKCKNIAVRTRKCDWCNNDFVKVTYFSNTMRMNGVTKFYCSNDCGNNLKQSQKAIKRERLILPSSTEGKYHDLIIEQRLNGMTLKQIAEPLGVSGEVIRNILIKNGIARRTKKYFVERICPTCNKPFLVRHKLPKKHCSSKCIRWPKPSDKELYSLLHCDRCGKWFFRSLHNIKRIAKIYKAKNKIQKNIRCSNRCK